MANAVIPDQLRAFEIPGRVRVLEGNGGLPKLLLKSEWSKAEVYLHGAHVTDFQKNGESPLLFLSRLSQFAGNKAIRGGVPVIFPWFGPRDGMPSHGFARTADWELVKTSADPTGGATAHFRLPPSAFAGKVEYAVTVAEKLVLELTVTNTSTGPLAYENCLHSYFPVGDIGEVSVHGLQDVEYLDKVEGGKRKTEMDDNLRITSEVDRVYLNTACAVEIHDGKFRRVIRVEKNGSASTVVWNPWVEKSKSFTDFDDNEYLQMICVESGNIGENRITLKPGESSSLKVTVGTT